MYHITVINVYCILFTLLSVFLYNVTKKFKEARQGLGGTKPLFVPSNTPMSIVQPILEYILVPTLKVCTHISKYY